MSSYIPESITALRLMCMQQSIKIQSLERELELSKEKLKEKEEAHDHFVELVSTPRGYKQYLRNTMINEAQIIKVA